MGELGQLPEPDGALPLGSAGVEIGVVWGIAPAGGTTSRGLRKNESQGCQSSVYEYLSCSSSRTAFRSENTPSKSDFTGTSAWISKIGRAVKRVGIQICVPARESDGVLADEPLCAWTVVTRPIKVQTCAVILPACELEGFAGGSAETYLG